METKLERTISTYMISGPGLGSNTEITLRDVHMYE
jgi:hypothetical protein